MRNAVVLIIMYIQVCGLLHSADPAILQVVGKSPDQTAWITASAHATEGLNPFKPNGLFYHNSLDRSISNIRSIRLVFIITKFY